MSGRVASLAPGLLFELINQRGRRPIHIVGWMLHAMVVNPSRNLLRTLAAGDIALGLRSVLIVCRYIAKNPGNPCSSLSVAALTVLEPGAARDISLSQHGLLLSGHLGRQRPKQACCNQRSAVNFHVAPSDQSHGRLRMTPMAARITG